MAIENAAQARLTSKGVAEITEQLNEIVHDLKNCMSILVYWVGTLETEGRSPTSNQDSVDDLKKIALKMNRLIERLDGC